MVLDNLGHNKSFHDSGDIIIRQCVMKEKVIVHIDMTVTAYALAVNSWLDHAVTDRSNSSVHALPMCTCGHSVES